MFQSIKYWLINVYILWTKIEQGIIQYKCCHFCGKKQWFEIKTCDCGECDKEIICVCRKCDDEENKLLKKQEDEVYKH